MQFIFLGATQTVTGSKTLIEIDELNILVDSGMYQGTKDAKEANHKPLNISPEAIDFILITHGHLDHCGYLPLLDEGIVVIKQVSEDDLYAIGSSDNEVIKTMQEITVLTRPN